jgi:hypothetical protein
MISRNMIKVVFCFLIFMQNDQRTITSELPVLAFFDFQRNSDKKGTFLWFDLLDAGVNK